MANITIPFYDTVDFSHASYMPFLSSPSTSSAALFYFIANFEEVRLGTSKTLHLTHINAQNHRLSSKELVTCQIARLILSQEQLEIQLHEKIASLPFEHIAFTGNPRKEASISSSETALADTQITKLEKREIFTVKTLTEEEYLELQGLFTLLFSGKEKSLKQNLEGTSKDESKNNKTFLIFCRDTVLLYVAKRFGQIIKNIQKENEKLREQEQERVSEENRRRNIKKRDQIWEQRMDRQLQKEENRWRLLKETMPPRVWSKLPIK